MRVELIIFGIIGYVICGNLTAIAIDAMRPIRDAEDVPMIIILWPVLAAAGLVTFLLGLAARPFTWWKNRR